MAGVIVAKEPVTFTWREIQWLQFYAWLVRTGRVSEWTAVRYQR